MDPQCFHGPIQQIFSISWGLPSKCRHSNVHFFSISGSTGVSVTQAGHNPVISDACAVFGWLASMCSTSEQTEACLLIRLKQVAMCKNIYFGAKEVFRSRLSACNNQIPQSEMDSHHRSRATSPNLQKVWGVKAVPCHRGCLLHRLRVSVCVRVGASLWATFWSTLRSISSSSEVLSEVTPGSLSCGHLGITEYLV